MIEDRLLSRNDFKGGWEERIFEELVFDRLSVEEDEEEVIEIVAFDIDTLLLPPSVTVPSFDSVTVDGSLSIRIRFEESMVEELI